MSDHRYAERTGELKGGVPQPPDYELLVAPNPGVATWETPAAAQTGAGQAGLHYGGAWDQPGTTGSAGFAGTTAAGGLGGHAGLGSYGGPVGGYGGGAIAHSRTGDGGTDYGAGLGAGASTLGEIGGRSGTEGPEETIGPAGHAGLGGGVSGYDGVERGGVGPGAMRPELASQGVVPLGDDTEGVGSGGSRAAGLRQIADQVGL
ncbi:hypothetical protein N2152v2_005181 [Parachlorella kessleri]